MKKLNLLKALRGKLPKLDGNCPVRKVIGALTLCAMFTYLVLNASEFGKKYVRAKVGPHVFRIMLDTRITAGGTGFSVKAPSGQSYIVTNSHVCNGVLEAAERLNPSLGKGNVLVVDQEGYAMPRRVLTISDKSDLCLIENLPDEVGLSLGSEADIGDTLVSLGHPLLEPLTSSTGEVIGKRDLQIFDYVMTTGDADLDMFLGAEKGKCDLPKNKVEEETVMGFGPTGIVVVNIKVCTTLTRNSYQTNMTIYPGNSGSPIVDRLGRVVGVAFAADGRTNYGYVVNLEDLKEFLSHY